MTTNRSILSKTILLWQNQISYFFKRITFQIIFDKRGK